MNIAWSDGLNIRQAFETDGIYSVAGTVISEPVVPLIITVETRTDGMSSAWDYLTEISTAFTGVQDSVQLRLNVTLPAPARMARIAASGSQQGTVDFAWLTVGNPRNAADYPTGRGRVVDPYRIAAHEVTNDQYAEFLNAVAASDSNSLFNSGMDITRTGSSGSFNYSANAGFGSKPVNYVSFFDAMRFVNWLENGQGSGGTESGVYTIGTGLDETRAPGASYFLPSGDEWYKAAYHDPRVAAEGGPPFDDHYWLRPTQSDLRPAAEAPPGGANSVNCDEAVGETTDVGAYIGTTSFYGAFDMGGNVWEWSEMVQLPYKRGRTGSSWFNDLTWLTSGYFVAFQGPTYESSDQGFRVASLIPGVQINVPVETRTDDVSSAWDFLTEKKIAVSDSLDNVQFRLSVDVQN